MDKTIKVNENINIVLREADTCGILQIDVISPECGIGLKDSEELLCIIVAGILSKLNAPGKSYGKLGNSAPVFMHLEPTTRYQCHLEKRYKYGDYDKEKIAEIMEKDAIIIKDILDKHWERIVELLKKY